jgi:hypothetical protein
MLMLQGERVLYRTRSGRFTLTTHRVRFERQHFGYAGIKSIMLEDLAGCAVVRESFPVLLILAVGCFLLGMLLAVQAGPVAFVLGLLVAMVLVFAYLLSQQQVIRLASAGMAITMQTTQMTVAEARELIDRVEAAKNARYFVGWVAPRA